MDKDIAWLLDIARDALERNETRLFETRTVLDGWLVTLSSAALAVPSVFSSGARLTTIPQWRLLAAAFVLLGMTIVAVLARRLMHATRVEEHSKLTSTISDALHTLVGERESERVRVAREAATKATDHSTRVFRLGRIEARLAWIAVGTFVFGMACMGALSLARTFPSPAP